MKTVDEIKQERDTELKGMEERYNARQEDVAKEKETAINDKDLDRYENLQTQENKNFDDYKENREEVWGHYQQEIDEKESDEPEK